nr:hypothetical protein [Tanacetum cinerariifolium]
MNSTETSILTREGDYKYLKILKTLTHQNTQQFGVMLPVELTNEDIRNSEAYKEYYDVASGATPPKTKASIRKTKSSSNTTITPPTAAGIRFSTSAKGKQSAKSSKAQDEGTGIIPGVLDVPTNESNEEISWKSSDEDDDEVDEKSDDQDDDDDDDQDTDNDGDDFDAEDDDDKLYRDVNINLEGRDVQMTDVHNTQEFEDTHVTLTSVNPDGQQQIVPLTLTAPTLPPLTAPTLPPLTIPTIFKVPQAPTPPTTAPSTFLQDLPNFGSYIDQRMNEAVKVVVQIQSERLKDEAQAENEEFLNNLDENIQKIIKEQVKERVKVQVSKILPRIEKTVNEQLEAKVLTRSSNSSKTSYVVAAVLSEMELRKILIEKMESNKSIKLSNEQRNLYKALVDAYESDKTILDTYGDTITLKRRRDDMDKDEEPSVGSDWGSKRRREGKEPESTSAPKEKATKTTSKSAQGSKSHQKTASESAPTEEPMQTTHDLEEPSHPEFETGAANDQPIAEASQHPEWFQQQKKPPTPYHNRESARDVYSKRRIIAVTELQIVEWHNYKHLDWITVRRDDDKLYKFKEGDFKRLRIQDIEDMLLFLVQGKLTNPTVEERFAFNVSLRMFTRSIVIQRRVKDLQLAMERSMMFELLWVIDSKPEPKGSTQGYPLVSVEVLRYDKRSKNENMEIVPTEMELILEHTQQGISHEVSVSAEGVEEGKRDVKIKGVKKKALLTH